MSPIHNVPNHPLAEVFGYLYDDMSPTAVRFRKDKLCPFGNKVPNCTKDKAENPLGVCSIFDGNDTHPAIICPVRFRQDSIILSDAASFFFPEGTTWTTLTEVRLNDKDKKSAGNIDMVMVAYDDCGKITDFGAIEIQGVYISGNLRDPFMQYMKNSSEELDWKGHKNYPSPDYLSSSRKRLAPQLIYKGGILKAWNKKTAVILNKGFFDTLPHMSKVKPEDADMAWIIYDLVYSEDDHRYILTKINVVYTKFKEALDEITCSRPGKQSDFLKVLQGKLDKKLEETPSTTPTLQDILELE